MKKLPFIIVTLLLPLSAYSHDFLTCAEKEDSIKQNLSIANAKQQTSKASGLEKALDEVQQHCTNDNLLKKYQNDIEEQKAKISEIQQDLSKAQRKGDAKKITKLNKKLAQKQSKLKKEEQQLTQFKAKLENGF